ncbi:hypothetical protein BDW62DRAFT_204196 [Aspergillus aurantiobrunneus]
MSFPNRLPADSYEGTIDGISVQWRSNAIENLPDNADTFMVDAAALKGATEHLAHASAKRLGKETVRIMYVIMSLIHTLGLIPQLDDLRRIRRDQTPTDSLQPFSVTGEH